MSQAIDFQSGWTDAWSSIANFFPKLLAFLAILIVGWFVAMLIARAARLLVKAGYDRAFERTGITNAMNNPKLDATILTTKLLYYSLMLFVFMAAFEAFGPNPISDYLTQVVAYLPKVVVAIVIVVIAIAIARAVAGVIRDSLGGLSYSTTLKAVGTLIMVIGAFAALNQLQIAQNVVNGVLYAALAAIVGVVVVAVGGGGIKTMSTRWESWAQTWDAEKPKVQDARRAHQAKVDHAQRVKTHAAPAAAPAAPPQQQPPPQSPVPGFDDPAYSGYTRPSPYRPTSPRCPATSSRRGRRRSGGPGRPTPVAAFVSQRDAERRGQVLTGEHASSARPCATTAPSRSSSAWLNPAGISSTWWVTSTSAGASGSAASSASRRTRSSRPTRSRPAAGSSSSSSSGSVISARAICTRLRSPSDSVP